MFVSAWCFITIVLTALLMGSSFAHLLEMPAKQKMDGQLWLTLQQNLYRTFATVGGFVEMGAIIATIVLTFLVRESRQVFILPLIATMSLIVAFFVVWIFITNKVNVQVFKWTAETIPPDWRHWRAKWEYSHAARFVLHLFGFITLLIFLLVDSRPH